jgi:colanic acid biosynthesis glycosyl transferase WcaI
LAALESWSYRKAAYVNAVTEGVRDALLQKKSVPPEKIMFLPNGVDTVRFQPCSPDAALKAQLRLDGKKVVLWAGTLGYAHGLEHVLQAAKLLEREPEIHFLFVGDGSAKSGLQRRATEMGLRNVTFCDPVPSEELARYFSIARVGLASLTNIPLWNATRPAKLFPLLASGKPVVFAGTGEGALLVQQAKAGIVVPPEDPGALAEAVRRLVSDSELCQELGQNGRRFVEANLQWSDLVRRWTIRLGQMQVRQALKARTSRGWKRSGSITRELP